MPTMDELLQAFAKLYDEGKMEQAMEIAGLIKQMQDMEDQQPEGEVAPDEIPTPMEEPVGPSVVRPELGPEEQLIGALETIASLGTGMTTGLFGTVGGTLQGLAQAILSGELGSPEAARLVEQYASRGAEAGTYAPRTEAGQRMTQAIAEPLSQLPPLLSPSGVGAPVSGAAVRQARLRAPSFDEQMARAAQMADEAASRGAGAIRGGAETFGQGVQTGVEAIAPVARRGVQAMRPTLEATPADLAAAEAAKIRLMTSDVSPPRTFMGKIAQSAGERVPIAGTGAARVAQQEQRVKAVEDFINEYAAPDALPAINAVAEDLISTRRSTITALKKQKTDVIEKLAAEGTVPVPNASLAIRQEIKRLKSLRDKDLDPVIRKLENRLESLKNQDLVNVESIRRQVGETFKAPDLAAVRGIGEESLSRIYGPLREDMTRFIKDNASPQDFTKWQVANKRLAELAGELQENALRNALKRGQQTPEAVASLLFANKPSYVRSLYRNLSEDGKRAARVALINKAGRDAGGIDNINPQTFAKKVKGLGDQIGIFFDKKEMDKLNGLVRALELSERAQTAGVVTATGQQSVPFVAGSFLTELLGTTGAAVVGAGSIGALARVYESAKVRNLLMRLGNTERGGNAERQIFTQLRTELAKAAKKFIEQSAPDAQVARELAKRAVPATAPETARTQLRELEESDQ